MNLRRLTLAEMLGLSGRWIDAADPAHKAIAAVPETAALLPRLKGAHGGLLKTQRVADPRLREIERDIGALDATHDDLARGVDAALQALSYLSDGSETRLSWEHLRALLLPDGLHVVNLPPAAAAGSGLAVAERLKGLSTEDQQRLARQKIGERSLRDVIDAWLKVAAALGHKDKERVAQGTGPSAGDILAVRSEWVRVVTGLVGMAEMAGAPAPLVQHVLAPLQDAAGRASRRGGDKDKDKDGDAPGPGPAPGPVPPAGGGPGPA